MKNPKRATSKAKVEQPQAETIHREGACGIRLDNINPTFPPDNEHTQAGTVALAGAVRSLAEAISSAAKALEETARHSQKSGVFIGNCSISNVQ